MASGVRARTTISVEKILPVELRVGADAGLRMALLDLAERRADVALAEMRAHERDCTGTPPESVGSTAATIAWNTCGTPAITAHCR